MKKENTRGGKSILDRVQMINSNRPENTGSHENQEPGQSGNSDTLQNLVKKLRNGDSIVSHDDFVRLEQNNVISRLHDIKSQEGARTYTVMGST